MVWISDTVDMGYSVKVPAIVDPELGSSMEFNARFVFLMVLEGVAEAA